MNIKITRPMLFNLFASFQTVEEWRIVFFITAILLVIGVLIFSVYGTAKVQPWAEENENEKETES